MLPDYKKTGYLSVLDKNIYYELLNTDYFSENNPLIIFLHEGLGSCRQWHNFPKEISDYTKCPVLMYDRYGYGKSEQINEIRTVNFLNKEALEFLPEILKKLHFSKSKIILIGHSDGGSISIIYAGAFPKNVVGLITEAAHVFIEDISVNGICLIADSENKAKWIKILKKHHGENTESMVNSWTNTCLIPEFRLWNIENYLHTITCPVMAIQGDLDNYGTFAQLESIKQNVNSEVELLYIPDCGHVPHQQATEVVKKNMVKFVLKVKKRLSAV
ncbi:MAG: alpha/beta hydrolase [Bacteroidia bacterium]|nr:alpha/beta hydrolase [Bacteroidia bacterium]